jgi:hypothetical protein
MSKAKKDLVGAILILAFMAFMVCVLLDTLDVEASRQITLAMMDRG